MNVRFSAALAVTFLATATIASAQIAQYASTNVTFRVPLNLTQLAPDISRVRVACTISSPVLRVVTLTDPYGRLVQAPLGALETRTSGGQLVTTLAVVVSVPSTGFTGPAVGQSASYQCWLEGFSQSGNKMEAFSASHTNPAFRLSPNPVPLTGSFTW